MDSSKELKKALESYKYVGTESKSKKVLKINKKPRKQGPAVGIKYDDLQPSLGPDLKVIFVGYNPGIQSSIQQHHYAHFTNLFWKLFNQSRILIHVLSSIKLDIDSERKKDSLLESLISLDNEGKYVSGVKPKDDFDLVKYKIGFTDLVLRCTRTAQELTLSEKLHNVPRLLKEFGDTNCSNVVFIGKGIWEIVVRYYLNLLDKNIKLKKDNFQWGIQEAGVDPDYNTLLERLHNDIGNECTIYVFPNTSGLVTSLNYKEKLELWEILASRIDDKELI